MANGCNRDSAVSMQTFCNYCSQHFFTFLACEIPLSLVHNLKNSALCLSNVVSEVALRSLLVYVSHALCFFVEPSIPKIPAFCTWPSWQHWVWAWLALCSSIYEVRLFKFVRNSFEKPIILLLFKFNSNVLSVSNPSCSSISPICACITLVLL